MPAKSKFYSTLAEASRATQKLGIDTYRKYREMREQDPKLPGEPEKTYPDWVSWYHFFGKEEPSFYESLEQASLAAQALGIQSKAEFQRRCGADPKLRSNPDRFYPEWVSWQHFLSTEKQRYATCQQASLAAQALGIQTITEYNKRYKEDPQLPSQPAVWYRDEWVSWPSFLGTAPYETFEEAARAARVLGAQNGKEYKKLCSKDPRLRSNPKGIYPDKWVSWSHFLGKE